MPHVPYVSASLVEPADLIAAIRKRRGGELLNLDRMLLHSPPLARGWNAFLGEIRTGLSLDPAVRELAISYVAVLNGAAYEYAHHAPVYLEAGGSSGTLGALQTGESAPVTGALSPAEIAVLRLTLEMTRQIEVQPTTLAAARAELPDDRALVELIAVIASYNMVSRFLIATGVGLE